MKLIIMRHGEAAWHSDDFQRELTEAGRARVASAAQAIAAAAQWIPTQIWYSPLVRARQTAEIVGRTLDLPLEEKVFLTPDDDPAQCIDALQALDAGTSIMLVSHMPFVGALTTLLVDGHRRGMPYATAQAIRLEMPVAGAGCAEMKGHFSSEHRA